MRRPKGLQGALLGTNIAKSVFIKPSIDGRPRFRLLTKDNHDLRLRRRHELRLSSTAKMDFCFEAFGSDAEQPRVFFGAIAPAARTAHWRLSRWFT